MAAYNLWLYERVPEPASMSEVIQSNGQLTNNAKTEFNYYASNASGVIYLGSMTKISDITDGTCNTFLVVEKACKPIAYFSCETYTDEHGVGPIALYNNFTSALAGDCSDTDNAADCGVGPVWDDFELGFRLLHFRWRSPEVLQRLVLRRLGAAGQLSDRPQHVLPARRSKGRYAHRSQGHAVETGAKHGYLDLQTRKVHFVPLVFPQQGVHRESLAAGRGFAAEDASETAVDRALDRGIVELAGRDALVE